MFSEAAEQLHITQPTLSKHIAILERSLDVRLLERDSSKVSLTEEGFYLLGAADEIGRTMRDVERTLAAMKAKEPIVIDGRLDDSAISSLVFSLSAACKAHGLPPVVFSHAHDGLPFQLLKEGRIDALVDMPPDSADPDGEVEYVPLMTRPMGVVLSGDNPLAQRGSVALDDLRDMTFLQVIWDRFRPGWNRIMELCRRCGFEPRCKSLQVRSFTEGLSAPVGDVAFLVPYDIGEASTLRFSNRVLLPLSDEDAVFVTHLMYRKDRAEKVAPLLQELGEALACVSGRTLLYDGMSEV